MRTIPIRQSLHKHSFVMGAERNLVMLSILISLLVGIGGLTLISCVSALIFWILAIVSLRKMAKIDPILSQVWYRHVRQQDFYPARASLWRIKGGFNRC